MFPCFISLFSLFSSPYQVSFSFPLSPIFLCISWLSLSLSHSLFFYLFSLFTLIDQGLIYSFQNHSMFGIYFNYKQFPTHRSDITSPSSHSQRRQSQGQGRWAVSRLEPGPTRLQTPKWQLLMPARLLKGPYSLLSFFICFTRRIFFLLQGEAVCQ